MLAARLARSRSRAKNGDEHAVEVGRLMALDALYGKSMQSSPHALTSGRLYRIIQIPYPVQVERCWLATNTRQDPRLPQN